MTSRSPSLGRDVDTHAVSGGTVARRTLGRAPRVEVGVLPRPDVCRLAHPPRADHRPAATQVRRTVLGAVGAAPPGNCFQM